MSSLLSGFSVRSRYQRTVNRTLTPTNSPTLGDDGGTAAGSSSVENVTRETLVDPSFTVTWTGNVVTTFRVNRIRRLILSNGNRTESEENGLGGTAGFTFRLPESLVELRNPIQAQFNFNRSASTLCVQRAAEDECAVVQDNTTTEYSMELETGFSQSLRGGMTFNYRLNDQKTISNKFSQITFTIFAQINFLAGQIR